MCQKLAYVVNYTYKMGKYEYILTYVWKFLVPENHSVGRNNVERSVLSHNKWIKYQKVWPLKISLTTGKNNVNRSWGNALEIFQSFVRSYVCK
jgi:hypothetical protein